MATSYNGWAASSNPAAIDIDTAFTAAGRKFPGGVKRGPVSVVFRYLVEQFDKRVEDVDLYAPGDDWGYSYRANVNNPSTLSCHSSGTALDINATRHPNGKRGTFTSKQVDTIRMILAELDGVVRWGGDFSGTPDEMHFEVNADATAVAKVAGRLLSTVPPATPPPTPPRRRKRMYLYRIDNHAEVWATDGLHKRWVHDLASFKYHFGPSLEGRDVVVLGDNAASQAFLDEFETIGG